MTDETIGAESAVPGFQIRSAEAGGEAAFLAFEQLVQDMFLIARRDPGPAADYQLELEAWHLGALMLGRFRSSGLTFDRPTALIASGLDHMLVQLYTEGGFTGVADGLPVSVQADEIVLFDLTRTLSTRAEDFGNITLLIPRAFFEASLNDVGALHGAVIPASHPLAGMLAVYMRALADRLPRLSAREAEAAARATADLATTVVAACMPPGAPEAAGRPAPSPSLFRAAVLQIEARLGDAALDADAIGDALGISRSTLYRVFEPVGGVADYIRRRRLSAAAVALGAPQARRIGEVAYDSGFSSEASFSRAFRAEFGLSPREARERSAGLWATALTRDGQVADGPQFARWMRLLRG